jgi:hypothetical protein
LNERKENLIKIRFEKLGSFCSTSILQKRLILRGISITLGSILRGISITLGNILGGISITLGSILRGISITLGSILRVHSTYANILKKIYKKVRKSVGIG